VIWRRGFPLLLGPGVNSLILEDMHMYSYLLLFFLLSFINRNGDLYYLMLLILSLCSKVQF
jgi:hypothetical protein